MSTLFVSAAGELEILRPMRIEHGSEKCTTVESSAITSSSSRTHLPTLWRIVSSAHKILWPLRPKHDLLTYPALDFS